VTASLVRRFATMGGQASLHLESDLGEAARLETLADGVERLFSEVESALSPYLPDSELSVCNRDGRRTVPASPLLADLARAARRAAAQTRGLVDATLPVQTREREADAPSLADALLTAPAPRAARPSPGWRTRQPSVDRDGNVCRPPGVTLDPGGIAKGMAADLAAARMPRGVRYAISCGGDLALGGRTWEIAVHGAHTALEVHRLRTGAGGVATSGIQARLWRGPEGDYGHHLLDPATGRPAWTGLVAVTAVAGSTLEAEILAKQALLSGPHAARSVLRVHGGVLQHDDGTVEVLDGMGAIRIGRAA
jgi:thiamine biosynthesis lipoprotein